MVLDIIAAVITYAAVGVGAWFIGGYMVKVFKGERVWLSRVISPSRASHLQDHRRRRGPRAGLDRVSRIHPLGDRDQHRVHVRRPSLPGPSPPQSREPPRCAGAARLQHGDQLRHQHQLAELQRRDHDELLLADRGARAAPVPQRRGGNGCGHRGHPRDRAPDHEHARQLLGRHGALHPVCTAADQRGPRDRARRQRLDPELQQLHGRAHAHQRRADDRPGPCCMHGGDQGSRHQRWRLLQRQCRASIRESQRTSRIRSRSSSAC